MEMELPGQNINDRFIGFYKFILQALDISKHGVSLLDASNVSLQLFSDVQKSNGLLISRFSPANPFARLIEAEITNKNPELFPSDLKVPVESPEVRSDPGTSFGPQFILSQALGLGVIVVKTLLQVFPGLFVTSQLKRQIFFLLSMF